MASGLLARAAKKPLLMWGGIGAAAVAGMVLVSMALGDSGPDTHGVRSLSGDYEGFWDAGPWGSGVAYFSFEPGGSVRHTTNVFVIATGMYHAISTDGTYDLEAGTLNLDGKRLTLRVMDAGARQISVDGTVFNKS